MSLQVKLLLKDNVAPPLTPPPPPPPIRTLSDNNTKKWQKKKRFLFVLLFFLLFFLFSVRKNLQLKIFVWKKHTVYWINQFMMWKQKKWKVIAKFDRLNLNINEIKRKLPLYFLLKQNVTHKTQYYNNEKY